MARHMVAITDEEWMELVKAQLGLLTSPLMHSLTLQPIEEIGFYWDSFGNRSIKNSKPEDGAFVTNGLSLDLRVICPEHKGGTMTKCKPNYDDLHDRSKLTSITQKTFGLSRNKELVTIEISANIALEIPSCPGGSLAYLTRWIPQYVSVNSTNLSDLCFWNSAEFTPKEVWYGLAEVIKTLVRKREESLEPLRDLRREIEETESALAPVLLLDRT